MCTSVSEHCHPRVPPHPQYGPHRVEAAVVLFPLTLDRAESYWTVAYGEFCPPVARPGVHCVRHSFVLALQAILSQSALWPSPRSHLLLAALSGIEQSLLAYRLGPAVLFNPKHPSTHWLLDTTHPGHMDGESLDQFTRGQLLSSFVFCLQNSNALRITRICAPDSGQETGSGCSGFWRASQHLEPAAEG